MFFATKDLDLSSEDVEFLCFCGTDESCTYFFLSL